MPGTNYVFVDGGLWANNPVVIALVEALEIAGSDRPIDIISVSTCAPPSGEPISPKRNSWGVMKWQAGSKALAASLCAQSSQYTGLANVLTKHLRQRCRVLRLEGSAPSVDQARHMNLDCTTDESIKVLSELAKYDADRYYGLAVDSDGQADSPSKGTNDRAERRADDFSILREIFLRVPNSAPTSHVGDLEQVALPSGAVN